MTQVNFICSWKIQAINMSKILQWLQGKLLQIAASVIFYTAIPLPEVKDLDFRLVAGVAPLIGLMIGGVLSLGDLALNYLGIPLATRSALVVVGWIGITGGLHLDGAMDTADGLAVNDPERRLQVMADSVTGAFGAMAAIAIILLKTIALIDISHPENRYFVLIAACGWGRWGQQVAILYYPYLKATGKGALHKQAITHNRDLLPGLFLLTGLSGLVLLFNSHSSSRLVFAIGMIFAGTAIATLTAAWFNHKLGGHTGDTYGAVVEWTEALFLCLMTI